MTDVNVDVCRATQKVMNAAALAGGYGAPTNMLTREAKQYMADIQGSQNLRGLSVLDNVMWGTESRPIRSYITNILIWVN